MGSYFAGTADGRRKGDVLPPIKKFLHRHRWLQGLVSLRVISIILLSLSKDNGHSTPFNHTIMEASLATIHAGAWMIFIGRLLLHWIFLQFPNASMLWQARLQFILEAIVGSVYSGICNIRRCILLLFRQPDADDDEGITASPLEPNRGSTIRKGVTDALEKIKVNFHSLFKTWLQKHAHPVILKMRPPRDDLSEKDAAYSSGRVLQLEMSTLDNRPHSFDPIHQRPQQTPFGSRTSMIVSPPRAPSRVTVDRGEQKDQDGGAMVITSTSRDKSL